MSHIASTLYIFASLTISYINASTFTFALDANGAYGLNFPSTFTFAPDTISPISSDGNIKFEPSDKP